MHPSDYIDFSHIKQLHATRHENAVVMPAIVIKTRAKYPTYAIGVYDANCVGISQAHHFGSEKQLSKQAPYIKPKIYCEKEVIYGGQITHEYGHFLIESLARLWFAKQNPDLPIVWDCNSKKVNKFLEYQKQILKLIGIKNEHIFITNPTAFSAIHVPEPGVSIRHYLHPQQAEFLGVYSNTVIPSNKVYISRSKIIGKGCTNEGQIEKLLIKNGWVIFHPQDFSIEKQLEALTTAEVCMMVAGSAQHSLLLTNNCKSRIIILPRLSDMTYNIIKSFKANEYYELNIEKSIVDKNVYNNVATFEFNISELENILKLSENFTNIPLISDSVLKCKLLDVENVSVPNLVNNANCSMSSDIHVFYHAMRLFKEGKISKGHKMFAYLLSKNKLPDFMKSKHLRELKIAMKNTTLNINILGALNNAQNYLEIGVNKGTTFLAVDIPHKTAVDPKFLFETEKYVSDSCHFYQIPSDEYFLQLKSSTEKQPPFDVIYIDGLHTFDQALRDFVNSLPYAHAKTIWLFDDTHPTNMFTALAPQDKARAWKKRAGLAIDRSWYGDVYKVIFALHDFYHEFSWCTYNRQTVVWKNSTQQNRVQKFESMQKIQDLRYEDFLEHSYLLNIVSEAEFYSSIYSVVDYASKQVNHVPEKFMARIVTDRQRELEEIVKNQEIEIQNAKEKIATLEERERERERERDAT